MSSHGTEKQDGDESRAYANSDFIPGGAAFPARWAAAAAAFRAAEGARARLGLRYGPGARQRLDLFQPEGAARGLVVFFHGGYWMESGREDWSHLAAGPLARGWAVAVPSYTLAPEARVAAITREAEAALAAAAALVEGPIALTGHSAGGHLAARLASAELPLAPALVSRLARVVPISPLSELGPLRRTAMNATLGLDAAEVAAESPARLTRRASTAVTIHVGGQERPAFLWQARLLAEAWACPWHVEPERHHFDVVEALEDPGSRLVSALVGEAQPLVTRSI